MNEFDDRSLDDGDFGESKSSSVVRAFDAFPKTKQTYLKDSTSNGGIFTILVSLACAWLTYTELSRWLSGTTTHSFSVEGGIAHDMQMNLDIVVAMRCADLHINVQDASGDRILASELLKRETTQWSAWVGPGRRYQAGDWRKQETEREQYLHEEDVHEYLGAARRGKRKFPPTPMARKGGDEKEEACRIFGSLEGNKVQGDFHITARGHGYMEFGEHLEHGRFNFSHHINELSFGPYFPLLQNPLDNTAATTPDHFYKYQYYLSIVPTIYTDSPDSLSKLPSLPSHAHHSAADGTTAHQPDSQHAALIANPSKKSKHTIYTNQYAVTEQSHTVSEALVPGIFFKYDIEPILLTVAEEWGGFMGLLIRCVNVVAGVLVAGGWMVSLIDWAGEVLAKRRRRESVGLIGKKTRGEKGGEEDRSGNGNGNGVHSRNVSYSGGGYAAEKVGGPYGYVENPGHGAYSPYGTPQKRSD